MKQPVQPFKKNVSLRLRVDLIEKIKKLAKEDDRTYTNYVERALGKL